MAGKTRLFIAVHASKEVSDYLLRIQKEFSKLGDFKFTNSPHITLKFLGWVDNEKLRLINNILNEIKSSAFGLALNNLGVFPSLGSAKVLWVGVSGNINTLQDQVENKLKKDFGLEERFKAHITLARIRKIT